eukprot:s5176_g1.t1
MTLLTRRWDQLANGDWPGESMAGGPDLAEQIRQSSKRSWKAALELLVGELSRQPVDLRLVGPVLSACARQAAPWPIALALLEASSCPGPIAYNSVANACERSGHWQQALAVVAHMGSIRLELDSFSFCTQMCSLAAGQMWSEALQLERRLRELGVERNTIICSAAINACAKAGQWRCGLQLLDTMVEEEIPRTTVTFSSAISACAAGAWMVALSLLGDMRKDQVFADTIVFSAAMSACEKAGQWTAALELFSQMQTLAVQLDTVSVSAVISACEKAAEWEAAVHLLSQALTQNLAASTVAFAAAISACENAAEWRVACALLQQLLMAELQLDAFPFSAAIAACAKVGQWQVSLQILQQMASHQVLADAATGSAMISACSNGGEWRWALHLLEGACPPDVFAHSAALSACEAAGKWQRALQLLSRMVQQTLPVDGISVGAVVGAVQRTLGKSAAVEQLKAICKGWLDASDGDAEVMEDLSGFDGLEVILQVEGLVLLNKASGVLTEDLLATLPSHATCISRLDAGTSGLLPVAVGKGPSRCFGQILGEVLHGYGSKLKTWGTTDFGPSFVLTIQ